MPITTPVLSYLQDATKTGPMLLIEVPTSLGRTALGYKRGGKTEGREKIFEESLSAVVWLFGVKTFNKIGDVFGKKVLGLKDLDTDVGKDSLRNPFQYVKDKKNLTAVYKFSKILGSVILGTLAMGVVVPKIKMAMSNALRKKEGLEPYPDKDGRTDNPNWADKLVGLFINEDNRKKNLDTKTKLPSMDDFLSTVNKTSSPSFKGKGSFLNGVLFASHNLENNTAWRLLSTDVGTLTGRVANSRTKKEGIEYFVRDSISSLFYIFAAPLFSSMIRKATKTPDINPKGTDALALHLKQYIPEKSFVKNNFFSSKILSKENELEILKNFDFDKNGTIELEKFLKTAPVSVAKKAKLMAELQPEYIMKNGDKVRLLSQKQVADVLSMSEISDPKFLKETISKITKGASDNPKSFISRTKLEKIRGSFDDCIGALEKYALKKSKNGEITEDIIEKFAKNLNRKNLLIHMSGIAFAVFGLSYLIPKFQYFVSEKITGEKEFLGTFEDKNNQQAKV